MHGCWGDAASLRVGPCVSLIPLISKGSLSEHFGRENGESRTLRCFLWSGAQCDGQGVVLATRRSRTRFAFRFYLRQAVDDALRL